MEEQKFEDFIDTHTHIDSTLSKFNLTLVSLFYSEIIPNTLSFPSSIRTTLENSKGQIILQAGQGQFKYVASLRGESSCQRSVYIE